MPVSSPASDTAQQLAEKPMNTPKGAVKVKFVLESKDNVDTVRVVVSGAEGASFKYAWTKNGEPAGEGDSISGFKRGDKIAVTITPFYDTVAGEPKTMSVEIKNSVPRVVESKQTGFDGKVLTYQVKAVDPDGDEVTYTLADAPKDMTIDKSAGTITWHIGKDTSGKYPVKVKISDGHGGEVIYELNMDIRDIKPPKK
ncbi:MAG TPA: putative Ig domain-containing protein [Dissulfurispiraceae bacterium]